MRDTVVGLFRTRVEAETALGKLKEPGWPGAADATSSSSWSESPWES
jgi:hypothetical protein